MYSVTNDTLTTVYVSDSDGYYSLRILELYYLMEMQMTEKIVMGYIRRLNAILNLKLNGQNTIGVINTRAISLVKGNRVQSRRVK